MQRDDEKFEIIFDKGVYDADSQKPNLHGKRTYTKSVAEVQKSVAALDRYDDFRTRAISVDAYKFKATGKTTDGGETGFGIQYDPDIHPDADSVLLKHQLDGATRFLSQLRGFGLLADVVGSGKTFEAGIILSELAVRGRLRSLLVVAPGQVIDSWVDVLENKFGMGKGALRQVRAEGYDLEGDELPDELRLSRIIGKNFVKIGGFCYPKQPILVDVAIFSKWTMVENVVFDAIVVDEAHHLSEEEGEFAKAMKLLSSMMVTKKKANSSYCLLLSATPHSGNLAKMFRLWYFIRCKGGNPKDFNEMDDGKRSKDYLTEKKYYLDYICNGATNVSDFIRRAKLDEFRDGKELRALLDNWISKEGGTPYGELSEYARSHVIDEFLKSNTLFRGAPVKDAVEERVASAYHNMVMRPIMIRQPNNLPRTKTVRSVLFYPMLNPQFEIKIDKFYGDSLLLDYSQLDALNLPKLTVVDSDGDIEEVALAEYLERKRRTLNVGASQLYREIVNKTLAKLKAYSDKEKLFTKKDGYLGFYDSVLENMQKSQKDQWSSIAVVPVRYTGDKLGYKYEYLKGVMRANPKKRIVVFFDYELPKKARVVDDVLAALKADKEFSSRVIESDGAKQAEIISMFNDKEDAVLIVKNPDFTEGANLQSSNIIVNYQVTPDPLAMDQRIGRIFRLGQKYKVFIHSLANINELEGFALGYFMGIGLMSSNSGDATILAGSNSDNMVAIRCKECGASSIEIMPKVEYEEKKQKDPDALTCYHHGKKNAVSPPLEKVEFSVRDFKCDKCGHTLMRIADEGQDLDKEGYQCSSFNDEGERGQLCLYVGSGKKENERRIYCSKLCAMSHCRMFKTPAMKDCGVLNAYRQMPDISEAHLELICENCNNTQCPTKCHYGVTAKSVEACRNCAYSGCRPSPYALEFDEKWETQCPNCGSGKLKPVVPSTFALYIRELWKFEYDGGLNFCQNLKKEMEHVAEIKEILEIDKENGAE